MNLTRHGTIWIPDCTERVKFSGFLRIYDVVERNGKLARGRLLMGGKNVLTMNGISRFADLLAGTSTDAIAYFALGDEGHVPGGNLSIPVAPTQEDTDLQHRLLIGADTQRRVAIGSVASSAYNRRVFTGLILTADVSDYSGTAILNEYALVLNDDDFDGTDPAFTDGPSIAARKTFPALPFTTVDRVGVQLEWEVGVK